MGEVEKKTKVEYNKSMDFDSQIGTTLSQIENEISSLLPAAPGEEWLTLSFGQLDSGIHPEHLEPLITPTRTLETPASGSHCRMCFSCTGTF